MKIDHIGYAVRNMEKAKQAMETLGYEFGQTIPDEDRNVYLSFGEVGGVE